MPKTYASPFNTGELVTLEAMARKANRATARDGLAPFYCAADGGDREHPDGWIFLAWPAMHPDASAMAARIFDAVSLYAHEYLGAQMQVTDHAQEANGER